MSKLEQKTNIWNNILLTLFAEKPAEPVHPHLLMVQWGYVSAIFILLLLTVLPMAVGGTKLPTKNTTQLNKQKWEVCYSEQGQANLVNKPSCETGNPRSGHDYSAAATGFMTLPRGSRQNNEKADSVDLFLKSLRKAFGS